MGRTAGGPAYQYPGGLVPSFLPWLALCKARHGSTRGFVRYAHGVQTPLFLSGDAELATAALSGNQAYAYYYKGQAYNEAVLLCMTGTGSVQALCAC